MRIGLHVVAQPARGSGPVDVAWIDEILERVDGYAIDRLSTGDVIGNHLECFAALGYMAARTSRVEIGPFITTPATRDVGLLAAAALSLDAMTGGRAYFVLGRGDGAARNLGLPAPSIGEMREAIVAMRALLRHDSVDYNGRTIRVPWPERPGRRVPVYGAPGGPKMLRMTAEVCDGVYLATGCTEVNVAQARETIDATPREEPLDVWFVTRFGIGETTEEAIAVVSEGLSSIGNHSLRGDYGAQGVPEELRPALREYHERYRWDRKNPIAARTGAAQPARAEPTNVELMNELGLRDYFLDRFGIVGTPDEIVDRLIELDRRGVDSVVLLAESAEQLDVIGTRILPRLAQQAAGA